MTNRPITLTSDFGLADPYVASMKGVILSLNPQAVIVDVSHSVRREHIQQGAFLLETALPHLPPGAVHLAVVDPGVGAERAAIALQTPSGSFVGPDNGVLSAALPSQTRSPASEMGGPVHLPGDLFAVALINPRYHRQPVSDTFHGRDIFAPAAAHLSTGVPLSELGEPVDEITALPPFQARREPDGSLVGRVIHVDTFGNLISDMLADDLPSRQVTVEICGHRIAGVQRTYAEGKGLKALVGSSGFLEIALPGGSAAVELGADIDEPVVIRT